MDHEMIKRAVGEAMDEKMKDFYIERETHYQHHQFIGGLISWSSSWKSACMKTLANCLVLGLITLLIYGFLSWGGGKFKG